MYIPASFEVTDPGRLAALMEAHSFATFVTVDGSTPFASHLPFRFHPRRGPNGTLVAHMARANPQWKHFSSQSETLVIFQGPHAYISPSWYEAKLAVPTWNYATVHAYGPASIIEDHAQIVELLGDLVSQFEQGRELPWSGALPTEFRDQLIQGIVAFEIPLTRIEGKFKLGQNRTNQDMHNMAMQLALSPDTTARALGKLIQQELDARVE